MTSIARQVAHQNQPGRSRHFIYCSAFLCFRLRRGGVSSPLVHLMWDLRLYLGISALVDWHSGVGVHFPSRPFRSVYIFSRQFTDATFLLAAYLARVCLGCMDREKPQIVQRLGKHSSSVIGQDQTLFFQMVEGDKYYFSF